MPFINWWKREFMRKKPEYGLGCNAVANKPAARWPLAAVMKREPWVPEPTGSLGQSPDEAFL
jgi:hypothetical protein